MATLTPSLLLSGGRRLERVHWVPINAQPPGDTIKLTQGELGGPCLWISHLGAMLATHLEPLWVAPKASRPGALWQQGSKQYKLPPGAGRRHLGRSGVAWEALERPDQHSDFA